MIMTDIEKLIKAAAPSDAQLPEGHLERFEARLAGFAEASETTTSADEITGKMNSNAAARPRTASARILRFAAFIATAAAAVAAVIFITKPASQQPVDWFAGVPDDPVEICLTYSEKAAELSGDILRKDLDGRLVTTVMSLTDSAVPMIDQLPDEMGDSEKAEVLRHYYSDLLNGLDKINKNI